MPAGSQGTARVEAAASEAPGRSAGVAARWRVCQRNGPAPGRPTPRRKAEPWGGLRARERRIPGAAREPGRVCREDTSPAHSGRAKRATPRRKIAAQTQQAPTIRCSSVAHVLTPECRRERWRQRNRQGASGIARDTIVACASTIEERLADLGPRLNAGHSQAPPVWRVEMPKGHGKTMPLGMPLVCASGPACHERSGSQRCRCGGEGGEWAGAAQRVPKESRDATTVRRASLGSPG